MGTLATYYRQPRAPQPIELQLTERAGALVGIVLDREHRREALRRSEELLSSLNRNVKEGLFRITPDLRLVYANRALAWLLGHATPESVLGLSLADAIDDPERRANLVRVLRESREWLNEEVRFRRADGTTFWGLLSVTAVQDETGALTHHDGGIADVTARKELEEQFRQSQKMEAVGKLAGGVAHDFNNLLTVMLGYADTIQSTGTVDGTTRGYAGQIVEAAHRASRLTRQLLAYSRQQVLSPQILDLTQVVDELGDMLRRLIGEDVQLVIRHDDGPCWVRIDRSQWEQVLLNLVVNARDAMPEGGTLTISTVRRAVGAGATVVLSVRDTGSGMTPEVEARAFDPFFTTKAPGAGTGLGLSTVHGIVNQSGGEIELETRPGHGTEFRVSLPVVEDRPPHTVATITGRESMRTGTVLVVEDEEEVRALVCRTLELDGHHVLSAGHGEAALEVFEQSETPIDLVVSDVVMPLMGGPELARRLRETHPGVCFLFISGYAEHPKELADLIGPLGEFLGKPFTIGDLSARVGAILARQSEIASGVPDPEMTG
jgi:PAS domain S-box-containing protein